MTETRTGSQWWHLYGALGDGGEWKHSILGESTDRPDTTTVQNAEFPHPFDNDIKQVYLASFDHEPTAADLAPYLPAITSGPCAGDNETW